MRVDIFRRKEEDGHFSYLVVPEGRLIPAEAANIDWELSARGMRLNIETESLDEFSIARPARQIQEKGYAISHLADTPDISPAE